MEKIIEINDIYDVLNSVNAVVKNSKNPKSMSSSKYKKAQEITNKVKYAWNSYMEAIVLESILAKINFKDNLSLKGQALYQSLLNISNKKNIYLDTFKKLIEKQKLGFFDEMNVASTYFIRYEKNEEHNMEYVLRDSKGSKNLQSILNSLTIQGNGILNILEDLVNAKQFAKTTPEEIDARLTEMSKKSNTLEYNQLSATFKNDLNMKLDTTKLDNIKQDYYKLIRQAQSIDDVNKLFEKYRNYISPETYLMVTNFTSELNKAKSNIIAKQNEAINNFENERNQISEKVFGTEKSNRIIALLSMLSHGFDASGKELNDEQKNLLYEELNKIKKDNPDEFKQASHLFSVNEKAKSSSISHEFYEQAKNKLDDSELSLKEQSEKLYYYNLYVKGQNLDEFIPIDKFSMLYDKYLKIGKDDILLLNEIVHYYLSYLDYLDKMKERCQDPSYANWEEYVNNMLMENGYIKGESR